MEGQDDIENENQREGDGADRPSKDPMGDVLEGQDRVSDYVQQVFQHDHRLEGACADADLSFLFFLHRGGGSFRCEGLWFIDDAVSSAADAQGDDKIIQQHVVRYGLVEFRADGK